MIKKCITSLLFILFFSITSTIYANDNVHYIFLIHGIGSNSKCFGSMNEALTKQLSLEDPSKIWKVIDFQYETGRNDKNLYSFSKDLADFIKVNTANNLSSSKISLIMHSQGGIIGIRMLAEMYKNNPSYHPFLKDHIDAFVTLGTPFYGSKLATFATRLKPAFDYLKLPFHDKFGAQELRDMELASDYASVFRKEMIDFQSHNFSDDFRFKSRALVISGITENLDFLTPIGSGKYRFEDDLAVPISTAHLDFYYYIENGASQNEVSIKDFSLTNIVNENDYMIVNAMHVSPLPETDRFKDIVGIPKRCIDINYEECDHPVFKPLVNHLLERRQDDYFKRDLTTFGIDLKLNFKNLKIKDSDLELRFTPLTKYSSVGELKEIYSKVKRWDGNGNLRYFTIGDIDSKKALSRKAAIKLEVLHKNEVLKLVKIPVEITKSTYVELDF